MVVAGPDHVDQALEPEKAAGHRQAEPHGPPGLVRALVRHPCCVGLGERWEVCEQAGERPVLVEDARGGTTSSRSRRLREREGSGTELVVSRTRRNLHSGLGETSADKILGKIGLGVRHAVHGPGCAAERSPGRSEAGEQAWDAVLVEGTSGLARRDLDGDCRRRGLAVGAASRAARSGAATTDGAGSPGGGSGMRWPRRFRRHLDRHVGPAVARRRSWQWRYRCRAGRPKPVHRHAEPVVRTYGKRKPARERYPGLWHPACRPLAGRPSARSAVRLASRARRCCPPRGANSSIRSAGRSIIKCSRASLRARAEVPGIDPGRRW